MENQRDPMIDMYVHETFQLLEQLENVILDSEKSDNMNQAINEIFRVMHTIKGNSMMMKYDNIASLAHVTEDLFDYLRTNEPQNINYSQITDIVLEAVDFFKEEVAKVQNDTPSSEEAVELKEVIVDLLESYKFIDSGKTIEIAEEEKSPKVIEESEVKDNHNPVKGQYKNLYYVKVVFEEDSQMENIRSFSIVHNLDEFGCEIYHYPEDLEDMEEGLTRIKEHGFQMILNCKQSISELKYYFERVSFLKELELEAISEEQFESYKSTFKYHESSKAEEEAYETKTEDVPSADTDKNEVDADEKSKKVTQTKKEKPKNNNLEQSQIKQQKYINVDVDKLDLLMNLVGELVVSEAMVTQNPELKSLNIQSIEKAADQMRKIINEIQDNVMEIRMVPLSMTFQRMNRIVRDMSVKTKKEVELVLIGQETEVDKNIIEHIADPLMHLIRNAIDHGIESPQDRKRTGKDEKGTVTLEAKNSGGDVWIIVRDDGKGLDKNSILNKAEERGLLKKPIEEYSDKEAFAMIFEAGLSTKKEVTNFSGRGVGMDAVVKELEKIGGIVAVESEKGQGTSMILRIPLTLAIINGMVMNVGDNKFTLPITSIRESFKARQKDIIEDSDKNAMIMVRGECYSIIRIHERYDLETDITDFEEGIFVMLENEDYKACLFVDQLIGEHQVVVKSFSKYIQKIRGISGCAHLGDGGICLILDPSGLIA